MAYDGTNELMEEWERFERVPLEVLLEALLDIFKPGEEQEG